MGTEFTSSTPPPVPPPLIRRREESLEPIGAGERIATLDVLRGFALFGILIVNMEMFSWPVSRLFVEGGAWETRWDVIADRGVRFFAEGKFYTLFSFLFGYGFAIQLERAAARGVAGGGWFSRRLLVLLGFGVTHLLLIWEGDILIAYSLFGFLLLAFQTCRPRTLLIWAALCLAIPIFVYTVIWGLVAVASLIPEVSQVIEEALAETDAAYETNLEESLQAFAHGNWKEIFVQRIRNWALIWESGWIYIPTFLAMFLVGMYAARRRILHNPEANRPFLRRVLVWGLCLGLPANAVYTVGFEILDPLTLDSAWIVVMPAITVGGPALCFAYGAALTLLCLRGQVKRLLRPVAAAGRMALSNYLLQSLICTTIFYSYGLGLYGSVGSVAGLGIAVLIYAAQLPLSVWWLNRFRFGPAEWLWRTLTYRRRHPMRVSES